MACGGGGEGGSIAFAAGARFSAVGGKPKAGGSAVAGLMEVSDINH